MYESHYGFSEKPFNLTPDPKYLYLSERHTEALAHLEYGRRERGGFILITGEVGTGKTTLARCFLSRLDTTTATAFVIYPALTAEELLRSTLEDLHVPVTGSSLKDHVDALHRFLLQARREGREVVLLIDEAQDLSAEVLEQVRLISNLETDTEKLIQIVLMGQSELNEMLARRELRQLAQRITARAHLGSLSRREAEDYIRHRMVVAGGEGKASFTPEALTAVHAASGGVPRLINVLCDRALLAGYVQGVRVVTAAMVRQATREVRGAGTGRPQLARLGLAAAALLALGALPVGLWWQTSRAAPPPPAASISQPTAAPAVASRRSDPESLVLALDREASLRGASAAVQALWSGEPLERTWLRTNLDQVRLLNLPAVLEMFHPTRRDTCFLALLRLEDSEALVSAEPGAPLRVPVADLDRLWTRQAIFLWRDFDSLAAARDPARTEAWTREHLGRLGYLGQAPDLAGAVARFQRDAQLLPDGVVGARTLMSLYSRGTHPQPRLTTGGAS
ncbi:MAG TPA: AAA family ATPase [Vicinamibacteria bacterium]|nr:AAA family ATPase [Vicinamibacteria bacterium]